MPTRKFAADDANLNSGSIITSRTKKYSDLNLLFAANTNTGDIYLTKDAQAVKTSVRNLILTNFFDKPFRPDVGSGVHGLLFSNATIDIYEQLEQRIRYCIKNFEPRAQVLNISVNGDIDSNYVDVKVEFKVVNLTEIVTLEVSLESLR